MQMINAYRVRGHLIADLDPLGAEPSYHAELDPDTYGLTIWDLDREFLTGSLGEAIGEAGPKPRRHPARDPGDAAPDLLRQDRLRVHEHPGAGAEALAAAAHGAGRPTTGRSTAKRACAFCATCSTPKSSSISCTPASSARSASRWKARETAIAILDEILERAAANNVHEIVIGMAHRGRLNVLANVVGKDRRADLLRVRRRPRSVQHAGLRRREVSPGRAAACAAARTAAKSRSRSRPTPAIWKPSTRWSKASCAPSRTASATPHRERVIPLLIHGDAAFAGQGVVAETLNLSQLDGYSHRRHHPPDHQQPDRLHHAARRIALHALLDRRRARRAGAHLPRQRRRSRRPPSAWRRSPSITASSSRRTW